jgi:putative ABC transport system substrate-binding protein
MMDRRAFLGALGLLAGSSAAEGQQAQRMWRIGLLGLGIPPACESDFPPPLLALRRGLGDLGYVEGRNFVFVARCPPSVADATPTARALAALNPDIIVTWSNELTSAVKAATSTIPVVFIGVTEPEQRGIVTSLAKPGGNLTGLSHMTSELNGKRLELLRETVPGLKRVGVLVRRKSGQPGSEWERAGLHPMFFEARAPHEIAAAFVALSKAGVGALLVHPDPGFYMERQRIVQSAAHARLPSIYENRDFATAGGLMAYGADISDLSRRAATYLDRILKGAAPANLPVEQPTKFDLVINLKTAKALGLTIPPSLLQRADQVIE